MGQALKTKDKDKKALHLFEIMDSNVPAFCSYKIEYITDDLSLLQNVKEAYPEVKDASIEVIAERNYHFKSMKRVAVNGFFWPTKFLLENVDVLFLWVKVGDAYRRIYKISADIYVEKQYSGGYGSIDSVYGNDVFAEKEGKRRTSMFYYISCTLNQEKRTGEQWSCSTLDECMNDVKNFDAKNFHYAEMLEDILGDAA